MDFESLYTGGGVLVAVLLLAVIHGWGIDRD